MSESEHPLVCTRCNVPLKASVVNPQPDDMVTCPKCGRSLRLQDAIEELGQAATEAIGDELKEIFKKGGFTIS